MTTKLTAEQVQEIRRMYATNECGIEIIAAIHGISTRQVRRIVNGQSWKERARLICPHCRKAI